MKIVTVRLMFLGMLILSSLTFVSSWVYLEALTMGHSVAWQSEGKLVDSNLSSPFQMTTRSSKLNSDFLEPGPEETESGRVFPHYLLAGLIAFSFFGVILSFRKSEVQR
jgi:hypothetical protein